MDVPQNDGTRAPAEAGGQTGSAGQQNDLQRQLDDKQDQLLRALAEMDNMRRRAQRDREEQSRYANETLLRDLVPILDNFDRALDAARSGIARSRAATPTRRSCAT